MLSVPQKEMILFLRQKGTSYAEIAQTLMLSPNTVKSICYRHKDRFLQESPPSNNPGVCKNCGAPLQQKPGAKKKSFCSDRCRYIWWNHSRNKRPYRLVCQHCGRDLISFGNQNRKFCGRECYLLSRYGEGLP